MHLPQTTPGPPTFNLAALKDPTHEASDAEWRRLIRYFQPRLAGYLRGRVDSADDLEDVLSAVWRNAMRGIHAFEPQSARALEGWLARIGERAASNHRRFLRGLTSRQQLLRMEGAVIYGETPYERDVLERLAIASDRTHAEQSLRTQEREFVRLKVDEEQTHGEIALQLGYKSASTSAVVWNPRPGFGFSSGGP